MRYVNGLLPAVTDFKSGNHQPSLLGELEIPRVVKHVHLQDTMAVKATWRHPYSSLSHPSSEAVGGQSCVARRLDSAEQERDH